MKTEKLFVLLQSGDRKTFDEAFSIIRGRIIRLAQQRLQKDEVEDVTQQTLSTFWEKRLSVREPDHLLPFLFQILRNKIGDAYRQREKWGKPPIPEMEYLDQSLKPRTAEPDTIFEQKELEKILKEAIEICASENKTWGKILQFLKDGKTRKEIHEKLGDIPMATVYTRIYRARQQLISILREKYGVDI